MERGKPDDEGQPVGDRNDVVIERLRQLASDVRQIALRLAQQQAEMIERVDVLQREVEALGRQTQ